MASIDETYGTQRMILKFDLSNALNTVTNSQPTPAKPAETPKNTQPSDKPADQGTKPTNSASTTTKPVVTTPAPKQLLQLLKNKVKNVQLLSTIT